MSDQRCRIVRLDDARFFVSSLFERTFSGPPPAEPVHYVAFMSEGGDRFRAVGYYHVAYRGEIALVGGLCVEPEMRGRGIGRMLELAAFENVGGARAFFAHVGDSLRATRVGFVETSVPLLCVRWMSAVDDSAKARLLGEVAAIGPF